MSTLSIPLPTHLGAFVETMVKRGVAHNKAEVIRQALISYAEEQAIASVLKAEQEIKDGKIHRGDLSEIMEKMA